MANLNLKVEKRKAKEKPKVLRSKRGMIPAVLYGHKVKNILLAVSQKEFSNVFQIAQESTIIALKIRGESRPRKVLIKEVQKDPVSDAWLHVDFYQVKMTEKIETSVILKFVGTAPVVKDLGGVLVKNIDQIEVSCLPGDLPREILVPIDGLKTFDHLLHIKDLKIPEGVEVLANPKDVVVSITAPRSEEELAALEEEVEEKVEEVEGVSEEAEEGEGETKKPGEMEVEEAIFPPESPPETPAEEKSK